MLFWIVVIALIVGIWLSSYSDWYWSEEVGMPITIISGLLFVIMLVVIIISHTGVDGYVASNEERYEALCYKAYSEHCRDEFGLLNKEVVDEIQEWNEDVMKYQKLQDDFWVGIFYPNVYDQFETIEYSEIK